MKFEITDTNTGNPKLTIAKDRVALKFNRKFTQQERVPYLHYAEQIVTKVGKPEFTFRGKFKVTSNGTEYIHLTTKGKMQRRAYYFRLVDGEVIEHIPSPNPLTAAAE